MNPFPKLFSAIAPFGEKELEDIRMGILKEMHDKQFDYYTRQLNTIVDKINEAFDNDQKTLDDDYFSQSQVWWQKESAWLKEKYVQLKIGDFSFTKNPGLANVLSKFMNEYLVKVFVGAPQTMPKQQIMMFRSILLTYFKNPADLWPIMLNVDYVMQKSGVTRKTSVTESLVQFLTAMISGSGPMVLKIFQQLNSSADKHQTDEFSVANLTKNVLSGVPNLTQQEVEYIKNNLNIDESLKKNMSIEPLYSGSLAQTHCSKFDYDPKTIKLNKSDHACDSKAEFPVVIKIMKPVYMYYFLCEIHFLLDKTWKYFKKIAQTENDPIRTTLQLRQVLMFLVREFAKEFDYSNEAKNTIEGYKIYNQPSENIRCVQLVEQSTSPFPCLVLELASRVPLSKLLGEFAKLPNDDPDSKLILNSIYQNLSKLLKIWVVNLFWGTGFFHADLHAGNILIQDLETLQKGQKPVLWVIDLGSAGKLTKEMQCNLIDAMLLPSNMHQFSQYVIPPICDECHNNASSQKIDPRNLAKFYKQFDSLANNQKLSLNKKMSSVVDLKTLKQPELWAQHDHNIKIAQAFVRVLWKVCQVKNQTYDDMQTLAPKIIDYSQPLQFGYFFLAFILHSKDIGKCTSNPTLMFGRAISYVNEMMWYFNSLCDDTEACPPWDLGALIAKMLATHPMQLANYLQKKSVC